MIRGRSIAIVALGVDCDATVVCGRITNIENFRWYFGPGYRPDRIGD